MSTETMYFDQYSKLEEIRILFHGTVNLNIFKFKQFYYVQ